MKGYFEMEDCRVDNRITLDSVDKEGNYILHPYAIVNTETKGLRYIYLLEQFGHRIFIQETKASDKYLEKVMKLQKQSMVKVTVAELLEEAKKRFYYYQRKKGVKI